MNAVMMKSHVARNETIVAAASQL